MKYESELIKEIVDSRGHKKSSLHYESECVETWIAEVKGAYPKLCDYQSEWLEYISILDDTGGGKDPEPPIDGGEEPEPEEPPIGEFPYETVTTNNTATVNHVVPLAYKSAILYGKSEKIDETLQSVQMPVLTTSNEDGTKTNILTVNEEVTLRGIGGVRDTLDCLTGEVIERIGEIVLDGSEDWIGEDYRFTLEGIGKFIPGKWNLLLSNKYPSYSSLNFQDQYDSYIMGNGWGQSIHLRDIALFPNPKNQLSEFKEYLSQNPITVQYQSATESIKTVDLTVVNQNEKPLSKIKPIEGTMHVTVSGTPINPTAVLEVPVEAITQNLNSFIGEE